jgi:hypothetical protein
MNRASVLLSLFALAVLDAAAADHWSVEAYLGDAYNFRTRLKVEQDGGYARSVNARYDTRGFESPLYYTLRGARWSGDRAWEVSLTHHKLYLQNPPPGVSSLSVSHGFNIIAVSRAFRSGDWVYRFGGGAVITHAEGTVNGITYDGPYKLAGAALMAGGGRRFYVGKSAYFSLEAMVTAAYASPAMSGARDAQLNVSNVAVHGLAGLGFDF